MVKSSSAYGKQRATYRVSRRVPRPRFRDGERAHRPRPDVERYLGLQTGCGGGTDVADVEDHVATAALEPVDEDVAARSTAPHRPRHRHLADEHERRRGVCDGDVVHVYVALAAVASDGRRRHGGDERRRSLRSVGAGERAEQDLLVTHAHLKDDQILMIVSQR